MKATSNGLHNICWGQALVLGMFAWTLAGAQQPGINRVETVAGADASALTLEAAIRIAISQNPELQAIRQAVSAAEGQSIQARLWPNPELELTAEEVPVGQGGFSESKNLVGLAQTVPFPGKKSLDKQIGNAAIRISQADYLAREIELIRQVESAFYSVLATEQRHQIVDELVELAGALAESAAKRVELGAAPPQEQLRAEIELELARTERTELDRALIEARRTLATLLGQPREFAVQLSGELSEFDGDELPKMKSELSFGTHPILQTARTARERAELQLRRATLEPWPDITVGLAGGRNEASNAQLVELRVSLPLPLFDRNRGKVLEARANAEAARAQQTAVEHRLEKDWSVAVARFQAAANQAVAYRERILPRAQEALRMVQGGFEQGKFGFIDYLDAQRTAARVRLAYQEKLLELNLARVDLKAILAGEPIATLTTSSIVNNETSP